jgi:hypothetical protein
VCAAAVTGGVVVKKGRRECTGGVVVWDDGEDETAAWGTKKNGDVQSRVWPWTLRMDHRVLVGLVTVSTVSNISG